MPQFHGNAIGRAPLWKETMGMNQDLLTKGYEPQDVESRWYAFWEKEGLFDAHLDPSPKRYSIVIPPPNVTGVLHMGHALNDTLHGISSADIDGSGATTSCGCPGPTTPESPPRTSSSANWPRTAWTVINSAGKSLSKPCGSGAKNTAAPSQTS